MFINLFIFLFHTRYHIIEFEKLNNHPLPTLSVGIFKQYPWLPILQLLFRLYSHIMHKVQWIHPLCERFNIFKYLTWESLSMMSRQVFNSLWPWLLSLLDSDPHNVSILILFIYCKQWENGDCLWTLLWCALSVRAM